MLHCLSLLRPLCDDDQSGDATTSLTQGEDTVRAVKDRLGKRAKRSVTIGDVTVRIGCHDDPLKNAQTILDGQKLRRAQEILSHFDLTTIRTRCLQNLVRWKANDVWCSAYSEWQQLCEAGSAEQLIAAMTGSDQHANRLRQSPPYAGLYRESKGENDAFTDGVQ